MFGYPHALILGGTTITQLSSISTNTNIGHYADMGAGQIAPQFLGSTQLTPDIGFSTKQIASLLALCSSANQHVCADLSAGNVDLYYRAAQSMGTRQADNSTVHLRARCEADALLSLTSISASQGGAAEVAAAIRPIYNGANLPLVYTSGVALSGTSAAAEQYALGPIRINGSWLSQVESMNLDINPTYDDIQHAGNGMNTFTALESIAPVVRVTTRELNAAAAYAFGLATSGAGIELFLRARLANGLNALDASTVHIKISAVTGKITIDGTSGQRGAVTLVIPLARSGATVLVPSIGVAIV